MDRARSVVVVVRDPGDVGERADVVLARRSAGLSRRVARSMALRGRLRIAGDKAPPSRRVSLGDHLELTWSDSSAPPLEVLAVNDDYVYANKPAGLFTHRLAPDDPPSLADAVRESFPECESASAVPRECGALHRLDRDTTGVVAFARHRSAWETGRQVISDGTADKVYVALCHGTARPWPPPAADVRRCSDPLPPLQPEFVTPQVSDAIEVTAALGAGRNAGLVAVRVDGQSARSVVWPLAQGALRTRPALFVAVRLHTGRRHQARVHLAWAGLPIIGDERYLDTSGESGGMHLHAHSLALGVREQDIEVFAPLPAAFRDALEDANLARWRPPG